MTSTSAQLESVMIIDDNEMDNLLNKIILEKYNYSQNIQLYNSPTVAIKDLTEGKITPDAIFVDINMPEMTGFEFVEAFEKIERPELLKSKLFIISSSDDKQDIRKAFSFKSVSKYLTKPLDIIQLTSE
ncbi:MAG: response regulator [Sporocytophaga sp.]|uniref:response regulator n=1 Tax=Sporocytophaga sp. TaxID=2231183 RepID=UPI001B04D43E|nr:response regulator [Sporocytophaga sp.]MBO9699139.1 response regulator [Sporocytophaga sp.]